MQDSPGKTPKSGTTDLQDMCIFNFTREVIYTIMSSDYILTIWHYWTLKFLAISRYKTVSHCGFNLHFPDGEGTWVFFSHMFVSYLDTMSCRYFFMSFALFFLFLFPYPPWGTTPGYFAHFWIELSFFVSEFFMEWVIRKLLV